MSDLRYDPIFDLWVAVAEARRDRPIEFVPIENSFKQLICPFCGGNEEETPPEIFRLDESGTRLEPGNPTRWQARVIPNKYPTYSPGDSPQHADCLPFEHSNLDGSQELVIPTPRHVFSLGDLTLEEFSRGLYAAQLRMHDVEAHDWVSHTMLFCNCRFEAGASVAHVHFQLINSPLISPMLERRQTRLRDHVAEHQTELIDSIKAMELKSGTRVVAETDDFVMVCPYASRMAFQVWILPRQGATPFAGLQPGQLAQVADLSQRYLKRIDVLLSNPAYNWMLHHSPGALTSPHGWLIEIVPRIAKTAGYELGTDIWINPVAPEVAARRLRG
jgi:UDPglucose--hexose-1-phosphate uridylyltransferase